MCSVSEDHTYIYPEPLPYSLRADLAQIDVFFHFSVPDLSSFSPSALSGRRTGPIFVDFKLRRGRLL
jgi:hypothetical protein